MDESLRLGSEADEPAKTERVLRVVQPHAYVFPHVVEQAKPRIDFDYLGKVTHLPRNPFYEPDDDPPNTDALAA